MDDIEKRARELPVVARLYERHTARCTYRRASVTRAEGEPLVRLRDVLSMIAALTPPDGYVLVPVEPTAEMRSAFCSYRPIQRASFECRYEEMIAARPEVP